METHSKQWSQVNRELFCTLTKKIFILLFILQSCSSQKPNQVVNVNGIPMQVHYFGDPNKPPLLFIHGNNGSYANGQALIDYFKNEYYVIAPDSRYHGGSGFDERELTYSLLTEDYHQLLLELQLDSLRIIGESDGGIIGLMLAMQHPEQIRQLVAIGANLRPDSTAIIPEDIKGLKSDLAALEQQIAEGDSSSEHLRSRALLRLMDRCPQIPDTALNVIQCPTLILSGEHDVIKASHSRAMAKNIPQGSLQIIPSAGHNLIAEKPEQLIKACVDFFKDAQIDFP